MTYPGKGDAAAWKVRDLIEAWFAGDADRFRASFESSPDILDEVGRHLLHVAGGAVQAVSNVTKTPPGEVVASVWPQLAAKADDETAQAMRALVTAHVTGDVEALALVQSVLDDVDGELLAMHLIGVAVLLGRNLARLQGATGDVDQEIARGVFAWLGVAGEPRQGGQ